MQICQGKKYSQAHFKKRKCDWCVVHFSAFRKGDTWFLGGGSGIRVCIDFDFILSGPYLPKENTAKNKFVYVFWGMLVYLFL